MLIPFITNGFRPIPPPVSLKSPGVAPWFAFSFLAPLYFGLVSFFHAATNDYIIQDDARLHIVWLQRLLNPDLFQNDAIAQYSSAIQSLGFKAVYGVAAFLGIPPLTLAEILPLALALITTAYLFWAVLFILPVPLCSWVTTLLLNQNIWLKDDLISASPRAFVYPIFAGFLYYLLRGSRLPCLLFLGLEGLFYPQIMVVSLGMITLRLIHWKGEFSGKQDLPMTFLSRRWKDYGFWFIALALTGVLLLTFSHQVSDQAGALIPLEEMKVMPEFQIHGRREYFGVSPLQFMFAGASGLRFPLFPPVITLGMMLPLMWRSPQFPLGSYLTRHWRVLGDLLFSALGLFLLAHAIFPNLYLPSRYTFYSFRFLMAIASGLVLTFVLHYAWEWLKRRLDKAVKWTIGAWIKAGLGSGLAIAILIIPAIPSIFLPCQSWVEGQSPKIYRAVAQSPQNTLVASLSPAINNIPAFSQRSVWVGEEFAIPYHDEFYGLMTTRMKDLLRAQYSSDLASVQDWLQTSSVDLWIIDQQFADPTYLAQQSWLMNSSIKPTVQEIVEQLQQDMKPALTQVIPTCSTVVETPLILLDAACISKTSTLAENK